MVKSKIMGGHALQFHCNACFNAFEYKTMLVIGTILCQIKKKTKQTKR